MGVLVLRRPRDGRLRWFQVRLWVLCASIVLSAPFFAYFGNMHWQPWYQRSTIEYFQTRGGAQVSIMYTPYEVAQSLHIDRDRAAEWDDAAIAPITKLTTLRECHLQGTAITDRTLIHLAKMPSLRAIYLSDTSVTDAGAKELVRLPALSSLRLHGTDVTDACLEDLAQMRTLRTVGVCCTHVTADGVERFQEMVAPRRVSVFHGECLWPDTCRRHSQGEHASGSDDHIHEDATGKGVGCLYLWAQANRWYQIAAAFDATGRAASLTNANGSNTRFTYDAAGNLAGLSRGWPKIIPGRSKKPGWVAVCAYCHRQSS